MKKNKKLLLGLTSLAAIASPIAAVVSCGSTPTVAATPDWGQADRPESVRAKLSATELKKFLDSHSEYDALTKDAIGAISINDLKLASTNSPDLDPAKKATINLMEKALQTFGFETNTGAGGKELNNFVKENAFSAFSSSSAGRSPFKTEDDQAKTLYSRFDTGFYPRFDSTGLLRLLDVDSATGDPKFTEWNSIADSSGDSRLFDMSYAGQNPFSLPDMAAAAYSVIRTRLSGKDVANTTSGSVVFDSKIKSTKTLSPGLTLSIGGTDFTTISESNGSLNSAFKTALETVPASGAAQTLSIKVAPGKKWAKAVNGNVEDSTEEFRASDFTTGLIRTLYASKEVRESGKLNGEDTGLPKLDDATLKTLNDELTTPIDSQNLYLFNLYGVDVKATIEANTTNQTVNKDATEFKIVFKQNRAISTTALGLLTDSNLVTPISQTRIEALAKGKHDTDLGAKYGLTTYGLNESNNANFSLDNILSVSPYLYTKYDLNTTNGEEVLKYNENAGYTPGNATQTVKTYTIKAKPSSADKNTWPQHQADNFKAATSTHEYLLNTEVYSEKTILDDLVHNVDLRHTSTDLKTGTNNLVWVPYEGASSLDSGFNDLGRRLFYGSADVTKNSNDGAAVDEFYAGTGADTRAIINEAINWYGVAQEYFPGQHKTFTPNFVGDGWLDESELKDPADRWTSYIDQIDGGNGMKEIYNKHRDDKTEALKSSKFDKASKELEALGNYVGASKDHPAVVPIFKYSFGVKEGESKAKSAVSQTTLDLLNKLAPNVKFEWDPVTDTSWSDYYNAVTSGTANVRVSGAGADYSGAGSINQQMLCNYGTFGELEYFREALGNVNVSELQSAQPTGRLISADTLITKAA